MEGRTCEDCGMYIPESQFHKACCVIKGNLLREIVEAWTTSKEAQRRYAESTETKARAVGMTIRLDEVLKRAEESLKKG
jgi:hypothetical protein